MFPNSHRRHIYLHESKDTQQNANLCQFQAIFQFTNLQPPQLLCLFVIYLWTSLFLFRENAILMFWMIEFCTLLLTTAAPEHTIHDQYVTFHL